MTPSEEEIETLAVWVEEHLIYLNAEGVAELAKILQIRRGRLKTSKGLKSKFELVREVRKHIDRVCGEDSKEGMKLLRSAKKEIISLKEQSYFRAANFSDSNHDKDTDIKATTDKEDHVIDDGSVSIAKEVKDDNKLIAKAIQENRDSETEVESDDKSDSKGHFYESESDEDVRKTAEKMLQQMALMHEKLEGLIARGESDKEIRRQRKMAEKKKVVLKGSDEDTDAVLFKPRTLKKNSMSKVIHSECTDSASDSAGDVKRRSRNRHDSGKEAKNSLRNKDLFYCGSVKSKSSSDDYTEYSFSEGSDGHYQKGYKKEGFHTKRKFSIIIRARLTLY
jgi:hypothetical protein